MDRYKTYHFTLTISADAPSPSATPTPAQADYRGEGSINQIDHGKESTTVCASDDDGIPIKVCADRQAENAATLHKNGKLIETVVEIAWNMALGHFRPNDSYEFHNLAQDWAAEFEALYDERVASCEWSEDEWRERCDHFTQEKLEEVVAAGLGCIVD